MQLSARDGDGNLTVFFGGPDGKRWTAKFGRDSFVMQDSDGLIVCESEGDTYTPPVPDVTMPAMLALARHLVHHGRF